MSHIWMVRAGQHAAFVTDFERHSVVAIGWRELGPLKTGTPKSEIDNATVKVARLDGF